MSNARNRINIFLLLCFLPQLLYGFGKNKVQYKNFDWYYLQSEHFDVYFYDGGEKLAEEHLERFVAARFREQAPVLKYQGLPQLELTRWALRKGDQ